MRRFLSAMVLVGLAYGCAEEPPTSPPEKAPEQVDQDLITQRQLSIEAAAEEATKIIEADAKTEIDNLGTQDGEN